MIKFASEYEPDVLNTLCATRVKECMSSLVLLPPRNCAVFERQFLLEYFTQSTTNFTMY